MIYEFKAQLWLLQMVKYFKHFLPHEVIVLRFLKLVCPLINYVVSIPNPASDNVDESSSLDHDDSNIYAVPSKHIEDNGKLFPLISFISSLKAVTIKFILQIKLKLKSEVHKLLHNPLPQCY